MKIVDKSKLTRSLLITHELKNVISLLNQSGIEVLVVKGALLAETVYSNPGMRPMQDIDLLAKEENIPQIKTILIAAGYQQVVDGDFVFYRSGAPCPIEFITELWYLPQRTNWHELWTTKQKITINGVEIYTLSWENNLIFTLVYGITHHGMANLTWLTDVQNIVQYQSKNIEWSVVKSKIIKYNIHVPFTYTFKWLAQQNLFDYFVFNKAAINYRYSFNLGSNTNLLVWFKEVDNFLRARKTQSWVRQQIDIFRYGIYGKLLLFPSGDKVANVPAHLRRLFIVPGLIPKLKYIFKCMFPTRDFILRRYERMDGIRIFFIRLLRPLYLTYRFIREPFLVGR